jgi:hypothetical protein
MSEKDKSLYRSTDIIPIKNHNFQIQGIFSCLISSFSSCKFQVRSRPLLRQTLQRPWISTTNIESLTNFPGNCLAISRFKTSCTVNVWKSMKTGICLRVSNQESHSYGLHATSSLIRARTSRETSQKICFHTVAGSPHPLSWMKLLSLDRTAVTATTAACRLERKDHQQARGRGLRRYIMSPRNVMRLLLFSCPNWLAYYFCGPRLPTETFWRESAVWLWA